MLVYSASCLLLAYGPAVILYQSSPLFVARGQEIQLSRISRGAGAFFLAQLCMMIFSAAVLPNDAASASPGVLSLIIRVVLNATMVVGMMLALRDVALANETASIKIFAIGAGWAAMQAVQQAPELVNGTRGSEFDWQYLVRTASINLAMITGVFFAALVGLFARYIGSLRYGKSHTFNKAALPFVGCGLAVWLVGPVLLPVVLGASAWADVVVQGALATSTALSVYIARMLVV